MKKFIAVVHLNETDLPGQGQPHYAELCQFELPDDTPQECRGVAIITALGEIYAEDIKNSSVTFSLARVKEVI